MNTNNSISDSKFQAWRACIAVIFLDKVVSTDERNWANDKINKLPLTPDQKAILEADLKNGSNLDVIIPTISDRKDLAFLVDTFRVLANIDKNFSIEEKTAFKKLEEKVLKNLDLNKISLEIEKMEIESYHEDEIYKTYNSSSFFEKTFNAFLKLTNPGDYKFPKNKK